MRIRSKSIFIPNGPGCFASRSPTTASAGRKRPTAAAWPDWPSGCPRWTGIWSFPARLAARPRLPSSCRSRRKGWTGSGRRGPVMRVVIAEDAALLREGLTRLLEDRGHTICAAVPDGDALLAAVAEHRPDVAVVDIRMPPTHSDEGLRAALKLRHDFPRTGVLVFSQYIETSYSAQLLEGGAAGVGYLLKDRVANVAEFTAALERVAGGGTALDPEVVSQLFRASRQRGGLATLTPRERQVLALMAEGRSNSAIAAELVVSGGAVEKHVASIFPKLGLPPDDSDNRRVLAVLHYLGSPALGVALGRHRRVQ